MIAIIERLKHTAQGFLKSRKTAYQLTFGSPSGQEVLQDLVIFCRANETCFHDDPRKHAVLEGRREVFLRIAQHLNLTLDQLFTLYNGKPIMISSTTTQGDEDVD